jgi:hypothetical protein
MRNVRKLVLLAAAAIAAMAVAATSASAQSLTVTDEATGNPCGSVSNTFGGTDGTNVSGGCLIHATSEATVERNGVELRKHVFGIESHITECNNEFHGRVGTNGTGYIYEQHLTGANCARRACNEATEREGTPWGNYDIINAPGSPSPAQGLESNSTAEGNDKEMTIRFCVESNSGTGKEDCTIEVPFEQTGHTTEFGHEHEIPGTGIAGFRCELIGHWVTEIDGSEDGVAEQEVLVTH